MSANIPVNMRLDDLLKATGYNCPKDLQGKTFDEATSGGGGGGDYPTLYLWKCEAGGIISYLYADFAIAPDTQPEGSYYNLGSDGNTLLYSSDEFSWENAGDVYEKVSDKSFTLCTEGGEGVPVYTRIDSDEDAPVLGGGGGGSLMNIPAFKHGDFIYYQGIKADGSLCENISDLANAVWIIDMNSNSGSNMNGYTTLDSEHSNFTDFIESVYGSNYNFYPSVSDTNASCTFSIQENTLTITSNEETVLEEELEKVDLPLGIALFSNHSS